MMKLLSEKFSFSEENRDSIIINKSKNGQVQFIFKSNPDRKILHTQQVELNGFIHSVLCGTRYESKSYEYFGKRAYDDYIEAD